MLAMRWATFDAALARAPSVCAICRGWGRGRICNACLDRFAARTTRCSRCALPLPLPLPATVCGACTRDPPFHAALAAVDSAMPWDRLVTAFKFHSAAAGTQRQRRRSRSSRGGVTSSRGARSRSSTTS